MDSNSKRMNIIEQKLVKYNARKDKYTKIKATGSTTQKKNAILRLKEVQIRIDQYKQELKLRKTMKKNITKLQGMDFDQKIFTQIEKIKNEIEELNKQMDIPVKDLVKQSTLKKTKSTPKPVLKKTKSKPKPVLKKTKSKPKPSLKKTKSKPKEKKPSLKKTKSKPKKTKPTPKLDTAVKKQQKSMEKSDKKLLHIPFNKSTLNGSSSPARRRNQSCS